MTTLREPKRLLLSPLPYPNTFPFPTQIQGSIVLAAKELRGFFFLVAIGVLTVKVCHLFLSGSLRSGLYMKEEPSVGWILNGELGWGGISLGWHCFAYMLLLQHESTAIDIVQQNQSAFY